MLMFCLCQRAHRAEQHQRDDRKNRCVSFCLHDCSSLGFRPLLIESVAARLNSAARMAGPAVQVQTELAEVSHQENVEGRAEFFRHLKSDRHAAAR
jgi:hypothetical protein